MKGTLYKEGPIFGPRTVGSAKSEDGLEYELCISITGSPLIQNKETGKYWGISWDELINLAREAGL